MMCFLPVGGVSFLRKLASYAREEPPAAAAATSAPAPAAPAPPAPAPAGSPM